MPMKLAPITTARLAALACAMIARQSASDRKRVDVRQIGARNIEASPARLRSHSSNLSKRHRTAIGEHERPAFSRVDRGHCGLQFQVDLVLAIPIVTTQWHPLFRSAAGKIIFRQVWPVDRGRIVVTDHGNVAGKTAPPQHLRGGETGRTAADNDKALHACAVSLGAG